MSYMRIRAPAVRISATLMQYKKPSTNRYAAIMVRFVWAAAGSHDLDSYCADAAERSQCLTVHRLGLQVHH